MKGDEQSIALVPAKPRALALVAKLAERMLADLERLGQRGAVGPGASLEAGAPVADAVLGRAESEGDEAGPESALSHAWEGFVSRGDARFDARDYIGAIADFSEAIRIAPNVGGTYFRRARALACLEEHAKAIEDCNSAIRLGMEDVFLAHVWRELSGWRVYRGGPRPHWWEDLWLRMDPRVYWEAAVFKCHRYGPSGLSFLELRIGIHCTRGNLSVLAPSKGVYAARSIDQFDKVRTMPGNPVDLWHRALARVVLLHDLQGAIRDSTQAIRVDPRCSHAYDMRAISLLLTGDIDGALADLDAMILCGAPPGYPSRHVLRATARLAKGDAQGARLDAANSRQADSHLPAEIPPRTNTFAKEHFWAYRNDATHTEGQYSQAVADADQVLLRDPSRSDALVRRAVVRMEWGVFRSLRGLDGAAHYAQAMADLDAALNTDEPPATVLLLRAEARASWGLNRLDLGSSAGNLLDLAMADYAESLTLNPTSASPLYRRSRLHMALGKKDEAETDERAARTLQG